MRTALAGFLVAACSIGAALAGPDTDAALARLGDDYFGAGAEVELAEPVGGDALLAGGAVESNASVEGDVTAAGGQVAIRATIGDDLYVAGGRVEVDALVKGNARIAGGRVVVAPESRIEGGTAIAGGDVDVQGQFGRYLTIAGAQVELGGEVAGDVTVYAESLEVRPGTRIGGRLSYRTTAPVEIPPDVQVLGGVTQEQGDREESGRQRGPEWSGWSFGWLWLAGLFAVGLLLAWVLAAFSERTTRVLTERPWAGLGLGFLVLALAPALAIGLAVTLIGLPLAVVVVLLYLATLIAGYVIGALFIGDRALLAARPGRPLTAGWRLVALFVVLVVLGAISGVPFVGNLARFAVLLLGIGGIVLALVRGAGAGRPAPPVATAG